MRRKKKKYLWLVLLGLMVVILGLGFFLWPRHKESPPPPPPDAVVKYEGFHLEIPKININAPIIPDVPGGDKDKDAYFKALEGGVAHFAGTKKPGEGGNIFIFGHSSFYPWSAGDYKEIFKDLDQLAVGDEILVWYNKKKYKYKVTETKIIKPDDVSVLESTNFEELVLMTCWPPGTIQKRLVIIAKPI